MTGALSVEVGKGQVPAATKRRRCPVPAATFPAFVLYLLLGTATLCSLGIALSAFTPTPDAASTIAPFSVVILSFVAGVWIPVDQLPSRRFRWEPQASAA